MMSGLFCHLEMMFVPYMLTNICCHIKVIVTFFHSFNDHLMCLLCAKFCAKQRIKVPGGILWEEEAGVEDRANQSRILELCEAKMCTRVAFGIERRNKCHLMSLDTG